MKKKTFTLAVMGLIAGTLFSSCETTQEKVADAEEKVTEAKAEAAVAQKDANQEKHENYVQFKAHAQEQIKQNDAKIEELRIKKRTTSGNDAEYKERINALKEKNEKLEEKLKAYDAGEKTEWQQFEAEFGRDMDGIAQAFKDLGND